MSIPYFPMYPTDFEAKTSHLTLEEDGAYNRLLRLMWMTPGCSLPDDPKWIARRMRVSTEDYERVVALILDEFCDRAKGRVFSPRLMSEFQKVSETHSKRSAAGKKGGRPANSLKNREATKSPEKAERKQPEPEPEPEPEKGDKPPSPPTPPDGPDLFGRGEVVKLPDLVEAAVSEFNARAERHGWSSCQKITEKRRRSISARLKEVDGLEGWHAALDLAEQSPFLMGQKPGSNFRLGIDMVVQPDNFTKLMEGGYGTNQTARPATRRAQAEDAGLDHLKGIVSAAVERAM